MALHVIAFSPTGTSLRTARAVAEGFGAGETVVHDLTLPKGCGETAVPRGDVAVVAVPVYGGHVPQPAAERLRRVHGDATPAVAIVVYGNRACDGALAELDALLRGQGFRVVAAGSFVGEHSYSTAGSPIAAARPDAADAAVAKRFGEAVRRKVDAGAPAEVDVGRIAKSAGPVLGRLRFVWGVVKLLCSGNMGPKRPSADAELCSGCGSCAEVCPAEAVISGTETDAERCIRCCACVKACPSGARTFATPFSELLSRSFPDRKEPQTLL
ncbi:MAG: 4Fe-4S binding protein [Alistipes sp.]|nr:4Fe-4S binding protein [Alistipes sp.]